MSRVDETVNLFEQGYGSNLCRNLLGFDLSQPGQLEKARAAGVFKSTCPSDVQSAAEILESMVPELK